MQNDEQKKIFSLKILSLRKELTINELMKLYNIPLSLAFEIIVNLVKNGLVLEAKPGKFSVIKDQEKLDSFLAENVMVEKQNKTIAGSIHSLSPSELKAIRNSVFFNRTMYQIISIVQEKPTSLLKLQNIFIGIKVYPILVELVNLNVIERTKDSKYISLIDQDSLEKINSLLSEEVF